jgi:Tfp pilus assembly protein PilV
VICPIVSTEPISTRRAGRAGLSLLEVVVALAILAFSIVAIGQLITMSGERAMDVEREAQGSMLCQRKLAELLIGPDVPTSSGYAPFPDDEPALQSWQWKADVSPATNDSTLYYQVQVSVQFDSGDGRPTEIQLGQMILDPTQRGSNQDVPANYSSMLNAIVQTPSGSASGASGATPGAATTPAAASGKTATPAAATGKTAAPAAATGKTAAPAKTTPSTGMSTGAKGS